MTATIDRAFPDQVDSTVNQAEWVPAHADMTWANVTAPECWLIDWEDFGLAPRGLDAARSLTYPALADRIYQARQADLDTHPGKVMAMFCCAKILNDTSAAELPIYEMARTAAAKILARM